MSKFDVIIYWTRRSLALSCLSFSLAALEPIARAADTGEDAGRSHQIVVEGSTTTRRLDKDSPTANVYVYAGGLFPEGTIPVEFQYLFDIDDGSNLSGYITPILFEQTSPDIYTVRGIGRGFPVLLKPLPQKIPFVIREGTKITPNANYTFGFINAIVDANGVPTLTSRGVVDCDFSSDGGSGLGGSGTTNEWEATNLAVDVTLGRTFGGPGADYPFISPPRTYSASASGISVAP